MCWENASVRGRRLIHHAEILSLKDDSYGCAVKTSTPAQHVSLAESPHREAESRSARLAQAALAPLAYGSLRKSRPDVNPQVAWCSTARVDPLFGWP